MNTKEKIMDALEGRKTFNVEVSKKIVRIRLDDDDKSIRNFFLQFYLENEQGRKILIRKKSIKN